MSQKLNVAVSVVRIAKLRKPVEIIARELR